MSRESKALGTRIESSILKRLDSAAYALRLSKVKLVTEALHEKLVKLEAKHNKGRPFRGRPKERSNAAVGKRKATRVEPKPKPRKKAGTNSAGAAPTRSRRRRKK
jgi:hypothetical protein